MREAYAVTFLLLMLLLTCCVNALRGSGWRAVVVRLMVGCVGGYLCSVVAITVSNDVANGWGTTARAANQFGWQDVASLNGWVAFVLCGWLLGIAVAALVTVGKRFDAGAI